MTLLDALAICNGCDSAPALPASAAGYCADCDAAPVSHVRPYAHPHADGDAARDCNRHC